VTPVTVLVSLAGAYLAFRAGSRWRHQSRAWSDYQTVRKAERTARKARWAVLKLALVAIILMILYQGAITVAGFASMFDHPAKKPPPRQTVISSVTTPTPHPHRSPSASPKR
jgi:hypothetical protein